MLRINKESLKANLFGLFITIGLIVCFFFLVSVYASWRNRPRHFYQYRNTSTYNLGDTLYLNSSGGISKDKQYFTQEWFAIVLEVGKSGKIKVKSLID